MYRIMSLYFSEGKSSLYSWNKSNFILAYHICCWITYMLWANIIFLIFLASVSWLCAWHGMFLSQTAFCQYLGWWLFQTLSMSWGASLLFTFLLEFVSKWRYLLLACLSEFGGGILELVCCLFVCIWGVTCLLKAFWPLMYFCHGYDSGSPLRLESVLVSYVF